MRRKDREITDNAKIDEIISQCKICRIGFFDRGRVYIVPMNFGFKKENGRRIFYLHSAKEGRKIDLIRSSPFVGFEMDTGYALQTAEEACCFSAKFQSVIGNGRIEIINAPQETEEALKELMLASTGQRDWQFNQNALRAVCALKLVVEEISCKEHR